MSQPQAPLARFRAFLMAGGALRSGALAFALGSLSVLAHAPFGVWPVMIFTLSALVWLLDGAHAQPRRYRSAAWRGFAFAFGYFFFGLFWLAFAFINRGEGFYWMIPFAVTLTPGGVALFWAAAAAGAMRFWTPDYRRILTFGLALFATEYARGHLFSGFPWNLPGLVWPAGGPVSQSAALFGVYGLSLLTLIGFAAPAALAGPDRSPLRRAAPLALSFALFACLFGAGLGRLARPLPDAPDAPTLRIVTASFGQAEKWEPANRDAVISRYIALSRAGGLQGVDIVLWPETALPVRLLDDGAVLSRLAEAVGDDALLGAGLFRVSYTPAGEPVYHNAFAVLDFDGGEARLAALYDKRLLVPFGEFIPGEDLLTRLGFRLPSRIAGGFQPGPGPMTLDAPGLPPFSPQICYEIIFPGFTPDGGDRPAWILNASNDAWFGPTTGPRQHLAQAQFRAIEEGLPVARAASGGVSAVIDSRGRLVAARGDETPGLFDAALPPAGPPTLFARLGGWTALSLFVVVLAGRALLSRTS